MALPLAVSDSDAEAWDAMLLRLTSWSVFDSRVRFSTTFEGTIVPVEHVDRGIIATRLDRTGWSPVLADPKTGKVIRLLEESDSFVRNHFAPSQNPFDNTPAIGHWRGGFFVADRYQYRIALYDWSGHLAYIIARDLGVKRLLPQELDREGIEWLRGRPPGRPTGPADVAHHRDVRAQEPQPWFGSVAPPRSDAKGRLWVLGSAADTTFADVFGDATFLGRLTVECKGFRGGWSLAGRYLAALCQPDDPTGSADAVLKLFRIVDQ